MPVVRTEREIAAPPSRVFSAVADPQVFADAIPAVSGIEFLGDQTSGAGTRFRETRSMKGKDVSTELEITEYEPDARVRIVSDVNGTVWDSVFSVVPTSDGATLTLVMEARPYQVLPRLLTPLIMGMVRKALEADMNSIKAHCEGT